MACAVGTVLPFVRGIDLTKNDFKRDGMPECIGEMSSLRWLRADDTGLQEIPSSLAFLSKLEHLSLKQNNLCGVNSTITALSCLRTLNLRHNRLQHDNIDDDLFQLSDLTTLDLSANNMRSVPPGLENAKSLLVLNLSENLLEEIPSQVFVNCTDLLYLNVADNKLETFPPQIRRLVHLKTLVLNNNSLTHFQFRQLPSLLSLETLHMCHTQRSPGNLPASLEPLTNLADVDLSQNGLHKVPQCLYTLRALRRLNLSDNNITELGSEIESWTKLEVLNICRNRISALPPQLCRLEEMRRLMLNENQLSFDGVPSGIGKLGRLEVFSAAYNKLEMIPEGLCRCPHLKRLYLNSNCLVTLPEAIHFITESLEVLQLDNNPDMVWPPKPRGLAKGSGAQFYNIDFSLQTQLSRAGAQNAAAAQAAASASAATPKDPIARKKRLRQFRSKDQQDDKQEKILKGMKDIAKDEEKQKQKEKMTLERSAQVLRQKRWDETLERPDLNYHEFFDENVGRAPGVAVWEIENFLPNQIEEATHGQFYEADCYIVLKTELDDTSSLAWQIYYWIGEKTTVDKKACAAIHAVNLRNYLGAESRTHRMEQGDEPEDFLDIFQHQITYIEGGRTASGFFTVEEVEYPVRMYCIHPNSQSVHFETVAVEISVLDPRHVFLLDDGKDIYVWQGEKVKKTLTTKTRLAAEKINKDERKNEAEIHMLVQGKENIKWGDFWSILGSDHEEATTPDGYEIIEHDDGFNPVSPRLYQVGLGMGYLELPQVEVPENKLVQKLLITKNVFILDCYCDVFVWIGRKSTRLVRAAALKLSQELLKMIVRPSHAATTLIKEGNESMVFKSKFSAWNDVIAVDFTRTADSVRKTGVNLKDWASKQETKVDLSALFTPRQQPISLEEAVQCMEDWNDDLDSMDAFVLEGKKFVKLPENELGHFRSGECYVFLCRYWVPAEPTDDTTDNEGAKKESTEELEDDFQCVVYFWQGRDASNMGWLTFTFSLQKKFELLFGNKLEVVRMQQQQEAVKFMAHFKRKFIIHTGNRRRTTPPKVPKSFKAKPVVVADTVEEEQQPAASSHEAGDDSTEAGTVPAAPPPPAPATPVPPTPRPDPKPELFQMRSNGSPLFTRCIQITVDAAQLNSTFCYILKVPFAGDDDSGIVYVWLGENSDPEEARLCEEITDEMFDPEKYSSQVVREGEEPENFFWVGIGGRKTYDKEANFMSFSRLFRCSNDKGYFSVSEKCSDFCQDDLADDDTMILDDGIQVFLWLGSKASDVEIKLALKSAQVYVQNLRVKEPTKQRKLLCTFKGKESKKFTRCFHGWGHFRTHAGS
uniref:Protein flightless-1-like n=1 Tax=Hirondellea gigas TaxID=1518452 RepID=A0A2P2I1Y5_9CRUS